MLCPSVRAHRVAPNIGSIGIGCSCLSYPSTKDIQVIAYPCCTMMVTLAWLLRTTWMLQHPGVILEVIEVKIVKVPIRVWVGGVPLRCRTQASSTEESHNLRSICQVQASSSSTPSTSCRKRTSLHPGCVPITGKCAQGKQPQVSDALVICACNHLRTPCLATEDNQVCCICGHDMTSSLWRCIASMHLAPLRLTNRVQLEDPQLIHNTLGSCSTAATKHDEELTITESGALHLPPRTRALPTLQLCPLPIALA
mmetsp:Transcript_4848/g.8421  ORF Transcript_4848/g.8421 Transcript_4848/m.8421 type:complete len:254 (+) Transcript_4848:402-1163(+)